MWSAFWKACNWRQLRYDLSHMPRTWRWMFYTITAMLSIAVLHGDALVLEAVNVIVSVVFLMLLAQRRITAMPWGILSALAYGGLCIHTGNYWYGVIQFFIYLPCCFVGPYYWQDRMVNHRCIVRSVHDLKLEHRLVLNLFVLSMTIAAIAMQYFYGGGIMYLFAITGSVLAIARILEQWYLWVMIGLLGISLQLTGTIFQFNGIATSILYIAVTLLSVMGLRIWQNHYDPDTMKH